MSIDEDQYELFKELLNDTNNTTEPSYVVSGSVPYCHKGHINQFGARFIPVFYYGNFLLSFLGNGLVLFIIYKYEKLNTVTNIFLLNLVFSNILFASSLPFWATYHLSEWIFGMAMCKLVSSAYFIGSYSSILFLTLMTFDRYLAVVHAVTAARSRKKMYAVIASVVVWCISIVASVKELILQNVWESSQNGLMCEETGFPESTMNHWRLVSYYQQFFLFFLLPLFMVMYCYISITVRILSTRMREKCRAIKLIFVIIFTFFACWTPYNIVILLQAIQVSSSSGNTSCSVSDSLDYALYVTRNIAYLYCCISPVFYTFVGKKFQGHFKRLMAKKLPCLKKHLSLNSQSTRTTSQKTPHSAYDYQTKTALAGGEAAGDQTKAALAVGEAAGDQTKAGDYTKAGEQTKAALAGGEAAGDQTKTAPAGREAAGDQTKAGDYMKAGDQTKTQQEGLVRM